MSNRTSKSSSDMGGIRVAFVFSEPYQDTREKPVNIEYCTHVILGAYLKNPTIQ